jgi:ATP-dependent DNA helicase RecG
MSAVRKSSPRKMMELAIKVMRQSVAETRDDGKQSPLVGAVLVRPDGQTETACRGELREGDHAEYTLLERKHRDARLDGAALFATLEPCAPGARKHPKLSCAERIVNARIKEVWVGIEDPDPAVDREGLRYLESKGVTVHMFDADLQTEIRQANRRFLTQAARRATEAKASAAQPVAHPRWEKAFAAAKRQDLSDIALKSFRSKIGQRMTTAAFEKLLVRQGFLARSGRALVPTRLGYLLFGKAPRDLLPQAGLKGTIHFPDGSEEVRDFDEPLVLIPSLVERWVRDKLPFVSDRSHMTRQEIPALPFEVLREAVINALLHRDYEVRGATCHIVVSADTITVRSPGAPPTPVSLEQLQALQAPMLNRNPKLQLAFNGARLAEGRGLGMKTFNEAATKHGLPRPKYEFDGVYLNLTIYRNAEAVLSALDATVLRQLSKSEVQSWVLLAKKGAGKTGFLAKAMGVDERTARRHLNKFLALGLVEKIGVGPAIKYRVK